MTVTYSAKVATADFSCFFKLLTRWRGSIYKILWKEFVIFSTAYFTLSLVYRFALTPGQKWYFEWFAKYCEKFSSVIPITFVLAFYVNDIARRWWEKFRTLPWPGRMAMYVTAHLCGLDERARLMRRTIMRYMCLSYVITMSSISPPVRKRFPTWKHMKDAGLMLPNEEGILDNLKTPYNKFFVPLVWASALVTRARKEGMIKDDFAVKTLIDEINDYRTRSFQLFNFDWVNLPLVYTQVVTLAVYSFFLTCLMGRQYLEKSKLDGGHFGDWYFPLFTFLQFLFIMGWLKVAETMLNPFGEDDDDFDINYLIDRHLKVSYLVVDEMHAEHPELIRDQYWDTVEFDIPYTEETQQFKQEPHLGSALDLHLHHEKLFTVPSSLISVPETSAIDMFDATSHASRPVNIASSARTNSRPHPSVHGSMASTNKSIFHRPQSSPRDIGASFRSQKPQPLSRITSKTSISSQTSERTAGGFLKSLKLPLILKPKRRPSIDASDDESHGIKLKPKRNLTSNSLAESVQSSDHHGSYHDLEAEGMVFRMSDSGSDSSETSFTADKSNTGLVPKSRKKHPKGRQKAHREDSDKAHHHHHHHHHHHQERRHDATDHHLTKKPYHKDGGRHKEGDTLFPINEDQNDTNGSAKDDLVNDVREKLQELQEDQSKVRIGRQASTPSAEMEIISLLGTSSRSNAGHDV